MKWALYNLLFAAVYPFLLPGFLMRMLRRGGYAARMGDRFALYPEGLFGKDRPLYDSHKDFRRETGDFIWIHAVSVGEVQVAGQLMREWRKVEPNVRFCFSTTSSTGWRIAKVEVAEKDVLIYNPLDFPNFVKSALRTVRPRAIVLTESEIWPNFILQAKKMGIPLFLINARVSDRSAPRYKAAKWFFGDVLSAFTRIFAQSDLDKARLVAAGAPEAKVEVTGSFKFDVAHRNEAKEKELMEWVFPTGTTENAENAKGAKIMLGGSTWPGEDEVLLRIYRKILDSAVHLHLSPSPLLVIAPRHFEKADAVEANILKAGFGCIRRSKSNNRTFEHSNNVFLADTTGELMGLYGIADVVFVGKSLCAHGSQNMIEPCLCGKPTLVGPYTENFRPVMSDLLAANAIVQVKDEKELEEKIVDLFGEDDAGLGARAKAAVEKRLGVVAKCVSEIRGGAVRRFAALLLFAAFAAGCSKEEAQTADVSKAPPCEPVLAAEKAICRLDALSTQVGHEIGDGFSHMRLNVDGMSAKEFRRKLKEFPGKFPVKEVHVWMPGEKHWLLTGSSNGNKISLAKVMEEFAADTNCTMSVAEVFASYVGTREEVLPAFERKLVGDVVPEWFVTKEIPEIKWLDTSDIDEDILTATLSEIRSMQVVRRLLLEGNMLAAKAKDKKGEEAAIDCWARAALRNPSDPMLRERIENLKRNAKGFLELNKVLQALKCYETIVLITPNDAAAVYNFGACLMKIGKRDMAEEVLKHAKELLERQDARSAANEI